MKIVSANLNGVRSALKKGFLEWLQKEQHDVICIQETKAHIQDIPEEIKSLDGYHTFWHSAEKKGYSGVGLITKEKPLHIQEGIGIAEFDKEGRFLRADYNDFSIISLYLPSGGSGEERQTIKYQFMSALLEQMRTMSKENREIIICGDWNIAHKTIDLANWRGNLDHSGFLPEERNWLTNLFENEGWVDVFRTLNNNPKEYTWWAHWGKAWEKDIGWRIDYHISTQNIAKKAIKTHIYKEERFSDHAPLIIEYDL